MKLKSGRTYWQEVNPGVDAHPHLKRDVSCDVAIVGGGVVGALLADQLAGAGMSVVLVDKRATGGGSTSASTALLLYELDVHLTDLTRRIGARRAARVYALSLESIATLKGLTDELDIGDRFRTKRSLYVAFDGSHVPQLRAEQAARSRIGLACELVERATLAHRFGLDAPAAILSQDAAEIDPTSLTRALLRRARARGARVFAPSRVRRVGEARRGAILETDDHLIRAQRLVMATGYESQGYVRRPIVRLKSSYVIVSEPIPGLRAHWLHDHLLWETARPYLYVRTTPDGRILVGGEDVDTVDDARRDAQIPEKSRRLRKRFAALFPKIQFRVAYAWAGTFGETPDGMGYVGVPPGWRHALFVLAYGGNGITFGATAAGIATALSLGRPSRDARLFAFDR